MEGISADKSPMEGTRDDRLDSWKEIAAYLKRDVTTVQRWEKREGMPVHRHLHDRMGSVYASREELAAWARGRRPVGAVENGNGTGTAHATDADAAVAEVVGVGPERVDPEVHVGSRGRWKWGVAAALGVTAAIALGVAIYLQRTEYFWRSPIVGARFEAVTDFEGIAGPAAISRDGRLVAFLSDRDGPMDVWVTQVGSGEYHNLTRGSVDGIVNPIVRTPGFSPDASAVTFWVRKPGGSNGENIDTWGVPTLGGQPALYLGGVAEFDWTRDGSLLAYHTSSPGDPLYVAKDGQLSDKRLLFAAAAGLHSHFPLWSPDGAFLYFVHGSLPDKLDVWRIRAGGGNPERVTSQNSAVLCPVFLDRRTLLYLATETDGSGPWLFSEDVERRIPHRLSSGPERYTSLAASEDGRRLVLTLASPKRTLWSLGLGNVSRKDAGAQQPVRMALTTGTGFAPSAGADSVLYVSANGSGDALWSVANGASTQLWRGQGAKIVGSPAMSRDGRSIALSVRQDGRTQLYVMEADGTQAHVVADGLELEGSPAWSPDGRSITTAAKDHGVPHLVQVPVGGGPPTVLVADYSLDPAWSPDGRFVLYSGPDVGTTFAVKAVTATGAPVALPPLTLTRGARHLAFVGDGRAVVFLQGDLRHKSLWEMDLGTGAIHALADVPDGFEIGDFDVSRDGREIVLERVQEQSDVVMLDLPPR